MWKNYWLMAVRNLLKRKLYTTINITGLAAGIACFILLALYLENEWTYDKWHTNISELYRLRMDYGEKGEPVTHTALTPSALSAAIKDFPEVKQVVRVYGVNATVKYGEKVMNEDKFVYADAPFFQMFSFPLLSGNAAAVLNGPGMVVLSRRTAEKYFGQEDPVGKTITINGRTSLQVTGVAENPPSNTHLKFDFIASYSTLQYKDRWGSANYYTYVRLNKADMAGSLHSRLSSMAMAQLPEEARNSGLTYDFTPEPVSGLHLDSIAQDQPEESGDKRYNYIFSLVAVMLLIIACVNFMNLATARAAERGREVGVRKTLGAERGQLFWQFIAESALITFIAVVLGMLLAALLLPAFNNLADKQLQFGGIAGYRIYLLLAAAFFITSFLTGTYPALFLSGFRPVQVLKGKVNGPKGDNLRRSLVVFQFAASAFFIICTLAVGRQLHYIQHKKLGQERDHLLVLEGWKEDVNKLQAFKNKLMQQAGIVNVTASPNSPMSIEGGYTLGNIEGKQPTYEMSVTALPVEKDYIKTMGINLMSGEDLTDADIQDVLKADSLKVYHFFLNETAVRLLGWTPETATGKRLQMNGRVGSVKGVMKDFHFASMKSKIKPLVIFPEYDWFNQVIVKTSGNNDREMIAGIEKVWNEYLPQTPFSFRFMDQDFNRLYKTEYRVAAILNTFSIVVMLVSCLGLLGLAALTTQQRTKEIGIRKVMGASVASVVMLLSRDFIKLVVIALILAAPLSWYIISHWLEGFAYHTTLNAGVFLGAAVLAVSVALVTVSLQTVKAALTNPVISLKSE
ncbi:ABC transporter permease [Chitinophaga solisilvae]|uniref:ABC transporter permease n=1 Tax=Chitinophaga solisilvae TaxID=1233460 RepID=UPI001368F5C3|nr:ABC transporter permease [Chitinophaga solisilvae]